MLWLLSFRLLLSCLAFWLALLLTCRCSASLFLYCDCCHETLLCGDAQLFAFLLCAVRSQCCLFLLNVWTCYLVDDLWPALLSACVLACLSSCVLAFLSACVLACLSACCRVCLCGCLLSCLLLSVSRFDHITFQDNDIPVVDQLPLDLSNLQDLSAMLDGRGNDKVCSCVLVCLFVCLCVRVSVCVCVVCVCVRATGIMGVRSTRAITVMYIVCMQCVAVRARTLSLCCCPMLALLCKGSAVAAAVSVKLPLLLLFPLPFMLLLP